MDSAHTCLMKSISSLEKRSQLLENFLPNLRLFHIKGEVPMPYSAGVGGGVSVEGEGWGWETFEVQ